MRAVHTYTTLEGRVLDLSGLNEEERAFFDRCVEVYRSGMEWTDFCRLVTSTENPLVRPAGGYVTRRVWEHPLFQALRDLEDRLGIRQGCLEPEEGDELDTDPFEDEWIPVAEAASRKGVTVQGLHKAIRRGDVIARPAKPGGGHMVVSVRSLDRWEPNRVRQAARKR